MTNNAQSTPEKSQTTPSPGLMAGFKAHFRGAAFLAKHPKLAPLAIIPIIINIILFTVFFTVSLYYFDQWLTKLLPESEAWYWAALSYALMVIMAAVIILITVFTFTVVANILASPFNDALSSATEAIVTGQPEAPFSIKALMKEIGRTIVEELKKIALYLAVVLLILALNLVPILGSILYFILFTALTIFWLGFGFLDYALARHGMRLGDKLKLMNKNKAAVFGYGLGLFAALMIPLFNLVFIPAAVVGGTLLYMEMKK